MVRAEDREVDRTSSALSRYYVLTRLRPLLHPFRDQRQKLRASRFRFVVNFMTRIRPETELLVGADQCVDESLRSDWRRDDVVGAMQCQPGHSQFSCCK